VLPKYVHFSWNSTIIRHRFQVGYDLPKILEAYKRAVRVLFDEVIKIPQSFKLEKKKPNVYMISLVSSKSQVEPKKDGQIDSNQSNLPQPE